MTTTTKKPLVVKKSVKHVFTDPEIAKLNIDFRQAYANLEAVEADAASVKSQLKAKVDEAAGRMKTLNATLQAGFEYRDTDCIVVFRPNDKQKDYYPVLDGKGELSVDERIAAGEEPTLTEAMTQEDFEQDLIRAESAFESRVEIELWDVDRDSCKLVVGRQNGRWFTALRGNIGVHVLSERLDGEQRATKKRFDAVNLAGKRVGEWLRRNLGKEEAKGFEDRIIAIVEAQKDKVE